MTGAFFWTTAGGCFAVRHAYPNFLWTTFTPSVDTKFVCVDPTLGNDANAAYDTQAEAESNPVQTLVRGYALLRDGYPDWLLLKRDEEFLVGRDIDALGPSAAQDANGWKKRGRGPTERMLVGAYGDESLPRPRIKVKTDIDGLRLAPDGAEIVFPTCEYLAFVSLDFDQFQRNPLDVANYTGAEGSTGVTGQEFHDVLMEDCRHRHFVSPITLIPIVQGDTFTLRHHTLWMNYGEGEDGGGMFTHDVTNLTVEALRTYHEGWLPADIRPQPVSNVSIDAETNSVVRASGSWQDDLYYPGNLVHVAGFASTGTTTAAGSFVLATGVESAGAYTDTATENSTYHELQGDGADDLDCYYEMTVSAVPKFVGLVWRWDGSGNTAVDKVFVDAWKWSPGEWKQIHDAGEYLSSNPSVALRVDIPLQANDLDGEFEDFVGTGGDAGKVRIRLRSTVLTGTFRLDRIRVFALGNNGDFPVVSVSPTHLELTPGFSTFVDEAAEVGQTVTPLSVATTRTRSAYISATEGSQWSDCIDIDGSSGGYQIRLGGDVTACLFVRQPSACAFGHPQSAAGHTVAGSMRYCVAVGARDIEALGVGLAFGLSSQLFTGESPAQNVVIEECIATMNVEGTGALVAFELGNGEMNGTRLINCISYKWANGSGSGCGLSVLSGASGDFAVDGCDFVFAGGAEECVSIATAAQLALFTFTNQRYYSPQTDAEFVIESVPKTYAEWVAASGETGSSFGTPEYPDPDRTIETYLTSLGISPATIEEFARRVDENRKGAEDPRFEARPAINYIRAGFGRAAI